ncbi:MAG TPA: hypothetical protein VGK31_04215 [Thermoanaerobaculia bacterium]
MRQTAVTFLIVLAAFSGCKGRYGSAQTSPQSETIAPAAAKPAPTGTDAMTQTVDIEDSRSDAEGLNQSAPAKTSTATAVKKKTGAAASSRKTPVSQSRPPGRTQ